MPERIYDFAPRGEFRILEAYRRALRSARRLIYIENQFLWSPHIVEILAEKLRHPPDERFRLLVLLPAKPNNGADSTRGQLGVLADADADGHRFLAATVSARTGGLTSPLYVHAKIAIVDDRWLTVGSANLNDHSLFNDTEMNVVCCDRGLAREARLRLWSEHLELPREEVGGRPGRRDRPGVAAACQGGAGAPPARRAGAAAARRAARRVPALEGACSARSTRSWSTADPRRAVDTLGSFPGRLAQLGERRLDKAEVTGSSPVSPIAHTFTGVTAASRRCVGDTSHHARFDEKAGGRLRDAETLAKTPAVCERHLEACRRFFIAAQEL